MSSFSFLRSTSTCRLRSLSQQLSYSTMASNKPIMLYTLGTPNGRKISIFLEELKANYGLEYEVQKIDFSKNEQKEPWFIQLNPNGRIPTIVDRSRDNHTVFETGAILQYLAKFYDKEKKFSFDPATEWKEDSEVTQWMFWANGGLGPMMGQAGWFIRARNNAAIGAVPIAEERYIEETKRLFGVLEIRLKDHEYLVGEKYSIADMNAYPWVHGHPFCGVESLDAWPALKRWHDKLAERESVKAGYTWP
ncbi:putative theta class glutathione s-transferase [Roridomyces roridus]|uniref:Theta class glutathione s-transferase n=1 Tax=Roridomyces roridus TaxID=1738132 RepID=A0AAD7CBD5_9AGAR|nr:putative theta class glutathione s-transferase [Roridomyces roridus]